MTTRISARAVHAPGLLARLAVVLNPHPVTALDYRVDPDGSAVVEVRVDGDSWHGTRAAARLRRVIGVTAVAMSVPDTVAAAGSGS